MNGQVEFEPKFCAVLGRRKVEADYRLVKPVKNGNGGNEKIKVAVRGSPDEKYSFVLLEKLKDVPSGYLAIIRQVFKRLNNQKKEGGKHDGEAKLLRPGN